MPQCDHATARQIHRPRNHLAIDLCAVRAIQIANLEIATRRTPDLGMLATHTRMRNVNFTLIATTNRDARLRNRILGARKVRRRNDEARTQFRRNIDDRIGIGLLRLRLVFILYIEAIIAYPNLIAKRQGRRTIDLRRVDL